MVMSHVSQITGIIYWNYGLKENNFIFNLTVNSEYGKIEINSLIKIRQPREAAVFFMICKVKCLSV